MPVSNDRGDWRTLTDSEKGVINKVVGGLALLDTLQSEEGVNVMREDARTRKKVGVINDFLMMESIHAKSYGTILSTLNDQKTIDDTFHWMNNDPRMQYKVRRINEIYQSGNNLEKKVASVFLEGILYYSNFFIPLWYRGNNKLANLSEVIKLVIRDESVHGTYLGYKFQQAFTEVVYAPIQMVEDVKQFVRYNANKAMNNMGFAAIFNHAAIEDINPIVMNGISMETANHDFFSQFGAGYLMGNAEAMSDEDYDF